MKRNNCPICDYPFEYCQCLVAGNAHPDREKRKQVIKDDLNLIRTLHSEGYLDREIAGQLGCSRELVSRKIREMNLR